MKYMKTRWLNGDFCIQEIFEGEKEEILNFIEYLGAVYLDDLMAECDEEDDPDWDDGLPFTIDNGVGVENNINVCFDSSMSAEQIRNVVKEIRNDLAKELGVCSCGKGR